MRITATIISEGVAVDALTGRITAFNILDSVMAPRLPAGLPRLNVLVFHERADDDVLPVEERAVLCDPNGGVIQQIDVALDFAAPFHTSVHAFWGIRFSLEGRHRIAVLHRARGATEFVEVARRDFLFQVQPHPLMPQVKEMSKETPAPEAPRPGKIA